MTLHIFKKAFCLCRPRCFQSSWSVSLLFNCIQSSRASLQISFCKFQLAVVVFSSCDCDCDSLICVWGFFFPFSDRWYCLMACITSEAVHCWRVRASCRVKGPSLVLLTPLHAAVLRSSSPISCTILRRYFGVSFRHCTSRRKKMPQKDQKEYWKVMF